MPNQTAVPLQLDSGHCRAICEEIGDRLRIFLDREALEMPEQLRLLLARLADFVRAWKSGQSFRSFDPSMHDRRK